MLLYVKHSGLKQLEEVFAAEGINFQKGTGSEREPGTGSWLMFQILANLPEVQVPGEYVQSEEDARAFRLPSGKLVITDLAGNLEQITIPAPGRA
jgi:hypothetical protein